MGTVRGSQKAAFLVGMVAAAAALVCLAVRVARQRPLAPAAPVMRIPAAGPGQATFRPGERLRYEFGWNGVPAAVLTLSLTARQEEGRTWLAASYVAATTSALEPIWHFEARGRALLDPITLLPHSAELTSRSRRKERRTRTRFLWEAGIAEVETQKREPGKVTEKQKRLRVGRDMPSAFLVFRSPERPFEVPFTLRVLNRDDAYEVSFRAVGTATVHVGAGRFEAAEYHLSVRELDDGEPDLSSQERYREVRVWVARELRAPVKLQSSVFVGQVYAELVGYEPGQAR
ncbi:MAG: DUF3108 domain-containing protein [Planctomycetota bacterium]|jgi:hypothetical protein